jgi:hypothetical protein
MLDRPALSPRARSILDLARHDRVAALKRVGELTLEEQVALVCGAPLARRAELLDLLPLPERAIPMIPEAELCFTVKAVGVESAAWLLEYATSEQVVACVDLDAWRGDVPDRATLDTWIDVLAETGSDSLLRSIHALDPELIVLFLKGRIGVSQKPNDEDWQPPPQAQTLDGQFYFVALAANDDLAAIITLLRTLFERDYWTYFRMMQGVVWELDTENVEWARRWRLARLEDLGFPSWEEAMNIYRYLAPGERAKLPGDAHPLDVTEWHLPVWVPGLPTQRDARQPIFRAIAQLGDDERRASFYALIALANAVAVADRMTLSDAEATPRAIEKTAHFSSLGLAFVAAENGIEPVDVLRRVPLERLFRVGANLDPEAAKP